MIGFLQMLFWVCLVGVLMGVAYDWLHPEERVTPRETWVHTRWWNRR